MTIQDLSNRVQSVLPLERGLYWGGEWHHPAGVATLQSFNPSTSELLGEVHVARPQDVDAAVGAARRAFPAWAATPPLDRSRCLREAAALAAETETTGAGAQTETPGPAAPTAAGSPEPPPAPPAWPLTW